MSMFSEVFAEAAVPSLMDGLGTAGITYTPISGAAVTLTAIVGPESAEIDEKDNEGRQLTRRRTLKIAADPSGPYGGVAAPAIDDQVTIDSVVYLVEKIADRSENLVTLELRRVASAHQAGRGHRYPG